MAKFSYCCVSVPTQHSGLSGFGRRG